jgi:GrpB-like predicted nucleotidyltransferase (UPF0157 family)
MNVLDIDEPIRIVPYDARWPELFEAERRRIASALGSRVVDIAHFGSTAVDGMSAKPIVDILVGTEHYPPDPKTRETLVALGYEDLGEAGVPGRIYLRLRGENAFNLALTAHGGDIWNDNLALRDYLRAHADVALAYGEEKTRALAFGATLLAYSKNKADFVSALIARSKR